MGIPILGALIGKIGDIFGGVKGIIDEVSTTDEERLQAKVQLDAIQAEVVSVVLDYEKTLAVEQALTVRAEVTGHSWLQRNWRPIAMLWMMALVSAYWLGFTPDTLTEAVVLSMFALVKIGLGGYIVGRSAEKIVPAAVGAFKKSHEA